MSKEAIQDEIIEWRSLYDDEAMLLDHTFDMEQEDSYQALIDTAINLLLRLCSNKPFIHYEEQMNSSCEKVLIQMMVDLRPLVDQVSAIVDCDKLKVYANLNAINVLFVQVNQLRDDDFRKVKEIVKLHPSFSISFGQEGLFLKFMAGS